MLAAVLVLSLLATALLAASKNWTGAGLGDLSQYYETGNSADPGYISTVDGDLGGTSYGIYMFASNAGTPLSFIQWLKEFEEGSLYRYMGDKLYKAYAYDVNEKYSPGYGSNFNANWRSVGDDYPEEFTQAQKDYWETHAYTDLLNNLKSAVPAFDLNNYSVALRNVLWSRSVHHGAGVLSGANSSDGCSGATGVVLRAFKKLGGFKNQSEAQLIQAIYNECSRLDDTPAKRTMSGDTAVKYGISGRSMAYFSGNSGDVQVSVYRRLHINEPADAVVMLYQNINAPLPNGDYRISPRGDTERAMKTDLSGLAAIAEAGTVQLIYYASGYYTLTVDGKRLTGGDGTVAWADPTAGNDQLWAAVAGEAPYCLQNRATGQYLVLSDTGVTTTAKPEEATRLQITAVGSAWGLEGAFFPGSEGYTTELLSNYSSYPIRGVVTSSLPISNITVKAVSDNGGSGFNVSKNINGTAYHFDLWELDSACTFSRLTVGTYTLTITGTNSAGTFELAKTSFTVGANTAPVPGGQDDEKYTVSFQVGDTVIKTCTYALSDTYGELPTVDGPGFQGWFREDGTEVSPNSPVAASNHTLYAKFGDLYTVTFKVDGEADRTFKLAKGDLITAPANPVKAADSKYTYSFKQWTDQDGGVFVADGTYMGTKDITYTAQFNKTAKAEGGGTPADPTKPSGGFLTGIAPATSIKSLNNSGYTVYSGKQEVTSGYVGTGMTAVSGSTSLTIVVTGDVNGDGRITITDVVQAAQVTVGQRTI